MLAGQEVERAWSSSETLATVESSTDELETAVAVRPHIRPPTMHQTPQPGHSIDVSIP
jgi:hypothetical protein